MVYEWLVCRVNIVRVSSSGVTTSLIFTGQAGVRGHMACSLQCWKRSTGLMSNNLLFMFSLHNNHSVCMSCQHDIHPNTNIWHGERERIGKIFRWNMSHHDTFLGVMCHLAISLNDPTNENPQNFYELGSSACPVTLEKMGSIPVSWELSHNTGSEDGALSRFSSLATGNIPSLGVDMGSSLQTGVWEWSTWESIDTDYFVNPNRIKSWL